MDFGPSGHSIAILKRDYREVVTKEDAKKYFSILVSNQQPSVVRRHEKTYSPEEFRNNVPNR
jgi:hypothetical protein